MGVPALFRWLSKKYPKIIYPVVEDDDEVVMDEEDRPIKVPVSMSSPNPNGTEFDNLYLDMNGLVHPCTHPEGKPAPETEEEMMVEIFNYTERVVNMIRPRKLLFMAIDGVAPRAKMNQQRARRFRAAQEAKQKEEERTNAVAIWESMGKKISEDEKNKKAWDTNAITPGTPFMTLLAMSLRYWVAKKMNSDAGWKTLQVIISDASVPGEGEHKIMDFIRRQRANPGHDPNTSHVIHGLDADLIMLALATHEPYFRVLREDLFGIGKSDTACRICGQEGHFAAKCTGKPVEKVEKKPEEKKPFIFLDIAILREYLEVELNVPNAPFPFNFEQSLDDWVLLIFFVGNDFLPHLPSLEIREGAIDTLLKIWKQELPRMGGYITNHGHLELSRAQVILDGVAQRENDIFKRRREAEERQDHEAKRRKLEKEQRQSATLGSGTGPSPALALTASTTELSGGPSAHPSLPPRPSFPANADSIGLGAKPTAESMLYAPMAAQALGGSNRDVVANRAAIRMANMSARDILKAEQAGSGLPAKPELFPVKLAAALPVKPVAVFGSNITMEFAPTPASDGDEEFPGFGSHDTPIVENVPMQSPEGSLVVANPEPEVQPVTDVEVDNFLSGVKRKIDEVDDDGDTLDEDTQEDPAVISKALIVNPDGTVQQEDTIQLWEPGYRERYYRQKFGVESSDTEFRKTLTKYYVEGLAWVLRYYYQGTPSWQWYYPYHFAPFAADFEDLHKMDLRFELGQPFKPYEQLMGVFPASSRKDIPAVFHHLMTDEDSPIIDFYPSSFEIDMNGKKMAWQGVALLPFIDPARLLEAMSHDYTQLTEVEIHRNQQGNDVLFVSDEHMLYPFFESLYGKRKSRETVPIDPKLSRGINGSVLPNPDCIPGSTYYSPLPTQPDQPDIKNDRSLTALYFFPKQSSPHRSVLLPGVKRPARQLSYADTDATQRYVDRNGSRGRGGYDRGGRGSGRGNYGGSNSHSGNGRNYGGPSGNQSYQQQSYQSRGPHQSYGGYGQGSRPHSTYGGQSYGSSRGGPPSRGGLPNSQYSSYSSRGGYGAPSGSYRGDYGGYGGQGNGASRGYDGGGRGYGGGGYGGYGGYGGQAPNGYGGYGGGLSFNNSRGRGGRGGY